MSYREKLEMGLVSGQMSSAEVQTHIKAGEMVGLIPAAVASVPGDDALLDKVIYNIDAVMNDCVPVGGAPPFMEERMAEMRAILRKLIASAVVQ